MCFPLTVNRTREIRVGNCVRTSHTLPVNLRTTKWQAWREIFWRRFGWHWILEVFVF